MALIEMNIHSNELEKTTQVAVIYPNNIVEETCNVLYLLHGYTGSHLDWVRFTNIDKLANQYNLVVVLPSGDNSFYTNMKYGVNYFNYISKELPSMINRLFKLNFNSNNTYIAGLSMGGYGALKVALTNPNNYQGVASLSGVVDVKELYEKKLLNFKVLTGVFGNAQEFNENINIHDIYSLSHNLINNNDFKVYLSCGHDDSLVNMTKDFNEHLTKLNVNHYFELSPGNHNWTFWDSEIEKVLKYFFKK